MARNVYGLDLGTYEIKVFDKRKNEIWCEKNVIAMKDRKYIFSLGDQAYEMYEKSPDNIQVVFPMKNGVIAHFDDMQYLLGNLLKTGRQFVRGSEYVIAVPTDVTEVEKKAFLTLSFILRHGQNLSGLLSGGWPTHWDAASTLWRKKERLSLISAVAQQNCPYCHQAVSC